VCTAAGCYIRRGKKEKWKIDGKAREFSCTQSDVADEGGKKAESAKRKRIERARDYSMVELFHGGWVVPSMRESCVCVRVFVSVHENRVTSLLMCCVVLLCNVNLRSLKLLLSLWNMNMKNSILIISSHMILVNISW